MFSLSSRVALVTGGGTGIGAGIASGLASAGATVVLVGRRAPPLEATARKINDALADAAAPSRCHALPADILDLDAAGDIVAQAAALGGAPVSILLNNAGLNVRKPAHELTAADWRTSLDLMLTAPFFLARACAPASSRPASPGPASSGPASSGPPRHPGPRHPGPRVIASGATPFGDHDTRHRST